MKVGDIVRVNKMSQVYRKEIGIVVAVGRYCKNPWVVMDDGMRADIVMDIGLRRFACYSLEVISESR